MITCDHVCYLGVKIMGSTLDCRIGYPAHGMSVGSEYHPCGQGCLFCRDEAIPVTMS